VPAEPSLQHAGELRLTHAADAVVGQHVVPRCQQILDVEPLAGHRCAVVGQRGVERLPLGIAVDEDLHRLGVERVRPENETEVRLSVVRHG
jgi:hypothetical protein